MDYKSDIYSSVRELEKVPRVLLQHIFTFLSPYSLEHVELVCRPFRESISDDDFWLYREHFKLIVGPRVKPTYFSDSFENFTTMNRFIENSGAFYWKKFVFKFYFSFEGLWRSLNKWRIFITPEELTNARFQFLGHYCEKLDNHTVTYRCPNPIPSSSSSNKKAKKIIEIPFRHEHPVIEDRYEKNDLVRFEFRIPRITNLRKWVQYGNLYGMNLEEDIDLLATSEIVPYQERKLDINFINYNSETNRYLTKQEEGEVIKNHYLGKNTIWSGRVHMDSKSQQVQVVVGEKSWGLLLNRDFCDDHSRMIFENLREGDLIQIVGQLILLPPTKKKKNPYHLSSVKKEEEEAGNRDGPPTTTFGISVRNIGIIFGGGFSEQRSITIAILVVLILLVFFYQDLSEHVDGNMMSYVSIMFGIGCLHTGLGIVCSIFLMAIFYYHHSFGETCSLFLVDSVAHMAYHGAILGVIRLYRKKHLFRKGKKLEELEVFADGKEVLDVDELLEFLRS